MFCSIQFHLNLVNIFMCPLDTSMSKTNIDLPVSSSLGNRRIICLKHRKNYYNVICQCVGFIFIHGALGTSEENLSEKGGKITP